MESNASIERAHRLLAEGMGRDHVEDPDDPSTVWAMQLDLRIPKADPPARSDLIAAAARAVVEVCLDERYAEQLSRWYGHRIRKVARRARNKAWDDAQDVPGHTVEAAGAAARAFVPATVSEVPKAVAKLQVKGTDLETDEPGAVEGEDPVVVLDGGLGLSAGKAAAQAGHASMLLCAAMPTDWVVDWAGRGLPLTAREVPHDVFARAAALDEAVPVVDAGFTEVDPDTTTALGLPAAGPLRGVS